MLSPNKPIIARRRPCRASATHGFSGPQIAVLSAAFTLLISIPIWTHPLPPLSDYVNHLARMHVIATLSKNPQLANFYEINWQVIPNLTMDLIVPLLARVMKIYLAGQVFMVGDVRADHLGHAGAQPRADRPLVGVAAVRHSAALQLRLPRRLDELHFRHRRRVVGAGRLDRRCASAPGRSRFALSTACAVVLFFCHLSALGVYGIGVLSFEICAAVGTARRTVARPHRRFRRRAACRSWPRRRCSMPARPCSWSAASTGSSAARSTG